MFVGYVVYVYRFSILVAVINEKSKKLAVFAFNLFEIWDRSSFDATYLTGLWIFAIHFVFGLPFLTICQFILSVFD